MARFERAEAKRARRRQRNLQIAAAEALGRAKSLARFHHAWLVAHDLAE